jgi:guanylate kinase
MTRSGNLIIVSGPSGAGKSALAGFILELVPGLKFSVSYTTRQPRGMERDGIEYKFVSRKHFDELIRSGDLLEWAEVYGNLYGTSAANVDAILDRGEDVILDIDVQGAQTVRQKRPDAILIFILPPSFQVLKSRLASRKLDKDYVIEQRLRIACNEIKHYKNYDYLIINREFESSVDELKAIVMSSRCRLSARAESANSIITTFGGLDAQNP